MALTCVKFSDNNLRNLKFTLSAAINDVNPEQCFQAKKVVIY
jgi:hypothetical protein